jgi:hypothetical protein
MNTPVTLISPKQRFQLSGDNVSKHRDLISSREFERAVDFAVHQYSVDLASTCTDANHAMAVGLKLAGAHEFLTILKNLALTASVSERPQKNDNLNHEALK